MVNRNGIEVRGSAKGGILRHIQGIDGKKGDHVSRIMVKSTVM